MTTKMWAKDVPSGADTPLSLYNIPTGPTGNFNTTSVLGPTAGLVNSTFLSLPLAAVTIAGTITFNLWGSESSMNANAGLQCKIERCNAAGTPISTIVDSEFGTELGTAAAVNNWTASPTSTTLADGDRLKMTILFNDAGGTMASGFTLVFYYQNGATLADSWVQFTEDIKNVPGAPPALVPVVAAQHASRW